MKTLFFSVLVALLLFTPGEASAQTAGSPVTTGTPAFGSFGGGPVDVINLANLNSHITVPIVHKPGRGIPFNFDLTLDSSVWYPTGSPGTETWTNVSSWGLGTSSQLLGYVTNTLTVTQICHGSDGSVGYSNKVSNWVYHDGSGTPHSFSGDTLSWSGTIEGVCLASDFNSTTLNVPASDGSGYTINTTPPSFAQLTTADGTSLIVPINPTGPVTGGSMEDRNGNEITSSNGVFTDTLGTKVLTRSGTPPSTVTYRYTPPALETSGGTVNITQTYRTYSVRTNFQCSGIVEYVNASVALLDRVTYPDASFYSFTYEVTPGFPSNITGRLASVKIPTGETISYTYTGANDGIDCKDGTALGVTRTTPDGSWEYSSVVPKPNSVDIMSRQTTVKDPSTNNTVLTFENIYENERDVYQGAISPANLLESVFTCNAFDPNVALPCASPLSCICTSNIELTTVTQLNGGMRSAHLLKYSGFGLRTETDDYDFGAGKTGSLLKKTIITYASLGNTIHSFKQSVAVQDGMGNTITTTNYNYDEHTPASTSGTPQHVAVTGSRGNLTSIHYPITSLEKLLTYYDTGNVASSTDVNGAKTSYTYGACGNSFLTSTSLPLNLTQSFVWDCAGGVELHATDENGKTSVVAYTDANFWRASSVTDRTGSVTKYTYPTTNSTESVVSINSGAGVDILKTSDGLGRIILSQQRQMPGSATFDSIETYYDPLGRPSGQSVPYAGPAGGSAATRGTTTAFDALDRVLSVSDAGGGTTSYQYKQNDVLVTLNPSPVGEKAKQRQLEYNALGELTSVCEITSGTGSGVCGQSTSATGYWTKYTYDALGDLITVTQNAQAAAAQQQNRTYTYDAISRLTSARNPESGKTSFTYDKDSACGSSAYLGDQVKRVDAIGNVTCYTYDLLHSKTSAVYSGPYASVTPNKYFVYDSATVNGTAMTNSKGRMAEAYNCYSPCTTRISDEGFSYSARGEITSFFTTLPGLTAPVNVNVSQSYWPNGETSQLQVTGSTVMPTISYGVDGEGRVTSASASSGQNPLVSTVYNVFGNASSINFAPGMADTYNFDPKTGRMTQYQANVNGQLGTGTLTWNANGTLQKLVIVDAFNSPNSQTCNYLFDDLKRLASANCGNVWSQTFTYDAFGNIDKSGTSSFQPDYNPATNRMTSLPGGTPTYDANGNILNDGTSNFTWDVEGRIYLAPYGGGSVITYDAFERPLRENGGLGELYGPSGQILAYAEGVNLDWLFLPLPGHATAIYDRSTAMALSDYGHADWIGSLRLISSTTGTINEDKSFAPFAEVYNLTTTPLFPTSISTFAGMYPDLTGDTQHFSTDARHYSSTEGRWTSPDPAAQTALHPENPQSLNRYAYALNNPLSKVDPSGLDPDDSDTNSPDPITWGWTLQPECDAGNESGCCATQPYFKGDGFPCTSIEIPGLVPIAEPVPPCDSPDAFGFCWFTQTISFGENVISYSYIPDPFPLPGHRAFRPQTLTLPWRDPAVCTSVRAIANGLLGTSKLGGAVFGAETGPLAYAAAVSGIGNLTTAGAQAYGVATGNYARAQHIADVATISTSPSGALTYVATGNPGAALVASHIEGLTQLAVSREIPNAADIYEAADNASSLIAAASGTVESSCP